MMTTELLAGGARIEGEDDLAGVMAAEIEAVKAKYTKQVPRENRGIYSRHASDWRSAVLEFVPTKGGKVKRGRLLKVENPGTADAKALIAWLFVEDLTCSEVESMSTVDWPLPDHRATVIVQPRAGA